MRDQTLDRVSASSLFAHALPHRVNLAENAASSKDALPGPTEITDAWCTSRARVKHNFDNVAVHEAGSGRTARH